MLKHYHEILKTFRDAIETLQGQLGGRTEAIWQVLPTFERLLTQLEDQRQCHLSPQSQLGVDYLTAQQRFSTNINLGWQKLNVYYALLDDSSVYVAAVVMHPRTKWRYSDKARKDHRD